MLESSMISDISIIDCRKSKISTLEKELIQANSIFKKL
jgi:hypothetical protein